MPSWKPSPEYGRRPGDYPMLPPGVRIFDPRRFRRYLGLTPKFQALRRKRIREAKERAEKDKFRLKDVAAVKARVAQEKGLLSRVAGKLGRFLGLDSAKMSEEKPSHVRLKFYVFEVFLVVLTVWICVNLILALSEAGRLK